MFRPNRMKARLAEGEVVFGANLSLASPAVAELIGYVGYDFVMIDGEHGPGDWMTHLDCIRAVQTTAATAMLRVPSNEPVALKRALDLGVEALLIPSVGSAEEAAAAVAGCRYPTAGSRGAAVPLIRASAYGLHGPRYASEAAAELLIAAQIETRSGVERALEIAAVDGIDALMLGPFDLSGDLGIPGAFDHPVFVEAIERIEAAARQHGKALGSLVFPGRSFAELRERGYRMIIAGGDVGVLRDGLVSGLQTVRGIFSGGPSSST
jgi:2-keto-3-deoxy-L-rhamnonate aldolase RhmA